mmetsp:Transcript_101089/g.281715  ORF Transcript_101089/g.281715 Transcript_101089/m.281715 type:complete len:201 (+) Transcript_101089:758-1360(+)
MSAPVLLNLLLHLVAPRDVDPALLAERVLLKHVLQPECREEDQRVPPVEGGELLEVDHAVVVLIELLHGALEVARVRRVHVVNCGAQFYKLVFVDDAAAISVEGLEREHEDVLARVHAVDDTKLHIVVEGYGTGHALDGLPRFLRSCFLLLGIKHDNEGLWVVQQCEHGVREGRTWLANGLEELVEVHLSLAVDVDLVEG